MRVTVLSGGIGGARFLLGFRALGHEVTVIGNTGDDITMLGLRICPDLDTVMYTLGDGISVERGWGREGETFRVREELAAYADGLQDSEAALTCRRGSGLATSTSPPIWSRSHWLAAGIPLSEVTRRLCDVGSPASGCCRRPTLRSRPTSR